MFLRLVVPLDGSARAERALDLAAALAQQITTREPGLKPLLILFQAVDLSAWLDLDERQDERTRATEAAARYLEDRAGRLRGKGPAVETVVRLGNPAEAILEQASASRGGVVIMSTHGRSGLARWALGSVAERVARSAPVPVLLLPDVASTTLIASEGDQAGSPFHILVPLDGSPQAEAALPAAIEFAQLLHADVRLLYVFLPKFEESSLEERHRQWDAGRRRVQQVERYLMRQAKTVQQAGVIAHWSFGYGMPGAKIIETAHNQQISLIVMTTQGRGGLVRWRLGSVAEEVLHSGRLPVALVPPAQPEGQLAQEAQEHEHLTNAALS